MYAGDGYVVTSLSDLVSSDKHFDQSYILRKSLTLLAMFDIWAHLYVDEFDN